jgi:hypothetical protein
MLRLSMPLISVHDLPAAINWRRKNTIRLSRGGCCCGTCIYRHSSSVRSSPHLGDFHRLDDSILAHRAEPRRRGGTPRRIGCTLATPDNTNTTTMLNAFVIVDLHALTLKPIKMLKSGQLSLRNANNQEPRMHEFDWSPGIGDPTIGGWLTVILYFLTMVSCWRTADIIRLRERYISSERYTWRAVSILFLALGINKQLDLQTALTELGRVLAYYQGWYGERQTVQVWFIVGVAITCITTAIILLIWARKSPAPTWLALLGTAAVLAFVSIRAASFHHIDSLIGQRILGLTWNWVLEMGGISLVLVASEWRRLNLNTRVTRSN